MRRRTFEKMITYFNQTVSEMDIDRKYKMTLLGMVTAIYQKYDEDVQHWIPCSEKLPEQYGNYLISIDGKDPDIGTINPNDPRGWSLCDANGFYWANDKALNITAWQTLPEPYKAESEEQE